MNKTLFLISLLLSSAACAQTPDQGATERQVGDAAVQSAGQPLDQVLVNIHVAQFIQQFRHGIGDHLGVQRSRLIVVTSLDEEQRGPYAFALTGLPVVHKPRLVQELPALLAESLRPLG